jgi:hypothetical protein
MDNHDPTFDYQAYMDQLQDSKLAPCPVCSEKVKVERMAQFYHAGCGGCGLEPECLSDTPEMARERWKEVVKQTTPEDGEHPIAYITNTKPTQNQ